MADFRGGRGKRAPYQTVMYRIPAPIKPVVEMMGHAYRLLADGVADPNGEQLIKRVEDAIAATGYQPAPSAENDPTDDEVERELAEANKQEQVDQEKLLPDLD